MRAGHMRYKLFLITAVSLCFLTQNFPVYGAAYEYDSLGRVTQVVYEDGSCVTYTYDSNGNITETVSTLQGQKPSLKEPPDGGQTGGAQTAGNETELSDGTAEGEGYDKNTDPGADGNEKDPKTENGTRAGGETMTETRETMSDTVTEIREAGAQDEDVSSPVWKVMAALLAAGGAVAVFLRRKKTAGREEK